MNHLWNNFAELIVTPFRHTALIWGIVPLYFALLLNELTSDRANFRTALQTGFSCIWSALQWLYPFVSPRPHGLPRLELGGMLPVNFVVTVLVLALGVVAFVSGLRRRFPRRGAFLGHTRFANYFMITIFPIQSRVLGWTWEYLIAITVFALPIWLVLHFGLMPVRGRR